MSEYQHVIGGRKEDAQRIYSEEHPLPKTPKEYLQQTKAKQLFPEKRRAILFVKSTDTLSHAFQVKKMNFNDKFHLLFLLDFN